MEGLETGERKEAPASQSKSPAFPHRTKNIKKPKQYIWKKQSDNLIFQSWREPLGPNI